MIRQISNMDQLIVSLGTTSARLMELLYSFDPEAINEAPRKGAWTAAQVADHITRSNTSIAKALALAGTTINRDPGERIDELRAIFLDFSIRFKSPDFILPTQEVYKKNMVIRVLEDSIKIVDEMARQGDLSEMITHPAFGDITKFEILHFVLYHTQRHIHQLENIKEVIQNKPGKQLQAGSTARVEIFKTNIEEPYQAKQIIESLLQHFPGNRVPGSAHC